MAFRAYLFLGLCLSFTHLARAESKVSYSRDVKPLLKKRCVICHGPLKQRAKLRLDTAVMIRKGGRHGPVLVPGHAKKSEIIRRIHAPKDERMPPEGEPLSQKEKTILIAWINQGATAPIIEVTLSDPKKHWSYQKPIKPALPTVQSNWSRNPIDLFIVAQHVKHKLKPRPEAKREVLLRRVYLDLIGVPPTREELHAFLNDRSADAYEKVVDRLLSSPKYGERWGRHWMDIWRYSDWYGRRRNNEIRYSQRHIWRWRDWIIESINANKGYDRMILEMIAGDELAPTDPKILRATGFLARNWYKFDRDVWMRDTVEHTAMGLLALTLKCARCHDHKYDPIPQTDYYRFRAFFEPLDVRLDPVGKIDVKKDGLPRVYDKNPKAPTYLFIRGDDRMPDKDNPLSPGAPTAFSLKLPKLQSITIPAQEWFSFPRTSTGRRLALAKWIANGNNPRTARVAVNHIWLRHFGKALVASVDNFGLAGKDPTHPQLLDWLAVEFVRHNWSMKWLHRLIVTSSTYRMTSTSGKDNANRKIDAENRYLWHMNWRRMEAEVVRDSVLHLAGSLDDQMGGAELPQTLGQTSQRRSLYFRTTPDDKMEMLEIFDLANPNQCYERKVSVIPQQSLALMNSAMVLSQARLLARRLAKDAKTNHDFIIVAFEQVLSRTPSLRECRRCEQFLIEQVRLFQQKKKLTVFPSVGRAAISPSKDPLLRAQENLVHVLLNHNDFLTIR